MQIFLIPMIFVLEVITPFIRLFVLSVRLFANMLAGHAALFVMLMFIQMVSKPNWLAYNEANPNLYYLVAPLSVGLVTMMSLLELMVAALQAFIFTLLTSIFIGLAKHPAH
jgi:F-type H+-transporting ATPase subunit a